MSSSQRKVSLNKLFHFISQRHFNVFSDKSTFPVPLFFRTFSMKLLNESFDRMLMPVLARLTCMSGEEFSNIFPISVNLVFILRSRVVRLEVPGNRVPSSVCSSFLLHLSSLNFGRL